MDEIKLDVVKARMWTMRVRNEVDATQKTLKEVTELTTKVVGSDDTIFQMIEKSARMMDEAWTKTCSAFERGWGVLQEGIEAFTKAGHHIDEAFQELQSIIR